MKRKIFIFAALISVITIGLSQSCKNRNKNLGTKDNPVIISFMPSEEEPIMEKNAAIVSERLSEKSGLKIKTKIAPDYISIIDELGSEKVDVAFINSLGYLLARDWSGAEALLQLKGVDGKLTYKSAIITNVKSSIESLKDIDGKSFAYTTPYSMAGYISPLKIFTEKNIKPSSTTFAESYDAVVELVYNNKVDAGAIYYHKPDPYGRVNDAREKLVGKYNNVLDKVKIIHLSDPIPNTPVVFRKELPTDVQEKLKSAFLALSEDPETLEAIKAMYDATGFASAEDKEFESITATLKDLGKKVEEVVPGGVTFYKKHIWQEVPVP